MDRNKLEIKHLAQKLINNQIDFIEGCRKIARRSHSMQDCHDDDLNQSLLLIRGISSQSDRFPLEKDRDTCSAEHLAELNLEKQEFIAFYKEPVLNSCKTITKLI